jgi:CelD/BcsL family acetyltransferase involved in cellulose biosynthesis
MTRAVDAAWEPAPIPIRIFVSDRAVFSRRLFLKVWHGDFLSEPQTILAPPAGDDLDGIDGYYFPSYPLKRELPPLSLTGGYLRFVPQQYRHYYVELTAPFETYEANLSAKTRATLRRKVRKFDELSDDATDFRVFRTPHEFDAFRALAVPLSATTYQDRLLDAGLPDDDGFWASIRTRAAADGVRGYLLCHRGLAVAYLCCPVKDGIVRYDFVGYAPAYRDHSPGTVLQWLALRDLMAEARFRVFDFTPGEGQHKRTFATGHVPCADVFVLRPSAQTLALVCAKVAVEGTVAATGRLAGRLGLKSRLKRLIRGT